MSKRSTMTSERLRDVLVDKHDPDYEITDEDKIRMYAYIKEQKEWRIRKKDADKAREMKATCGRSTKCTSGYSTDLWAESRRTQDT